MKKIYIAIVFIALIGGFAAGMQYTIYKSTLAFNENNTFELNINNHRYFKDNQKTKKVF